MDMFHKLKMWHRSKFGLLTFGLAELGLCYGSVSWAVDSGRLSAWLLAIILFIGAIQNYVKLVWNLVHGHKAAKA